MIANGYFQRFFTMVFDVQREGMLKETNGMSEFTGRMQEQRNITLEEKHKQKEETNKQTNLNFTYLHLRKTKMERQVYLKVKRSSNIFLAYRSFQMAIKMTPPQCENISQTHRIFTLKKRYLHPIEPYQDDHRHKSAQLDNEHDTEAVMPE